MVPEKKVEKILRSLTLEEKVRLCAGASTMRTAAIPEKGIEEIVMSDGPQAVRLEDGRKTTALPNTLSLAASFDTAAAFEFGALLGREARANGIHVMLGPAINLTRCPLNGRTFEYMGEDPFLAGTIAAGYISGCQSNGVGTALKHLALNNQELLRLTTSANVTEKTLRFYTRAFEIAIRKASPWMVMSSYNRINGVYASENCHVQQEIIKDECNFDGVMVSDWGGCHDAWRAALGGLDLEMPGSTYNHFAKSLLYLVRGGYVPQAIIDDKARRIIRLMLRTHQPGKAEVNTPRHAKIARTLAQKGAVLLKNENSLLPLDAKKIKRIVLTGPNADFKHHAHSIFEGGGSGAAHPPYEITPLAGLQKFFGGKVEIDYQPGVLFDSAEGVDPKLLVDWQAEFYDPDAAKTKKNKPFLVCPVKEFPLCWNNFSDSEEAAGEAAQNSDDVPLARPFRLLLCGKIVPESSGMAHLRCTAAAATVKSAKIDGKEILFTPSNRLTCCEAQLNVNAGKVVEVKIEIDRTNSNSGSFYLHFAMEAELDKRIQDAVNAAKKADAVIFVGGVNHHYDKEAIGGGFLADADYPDLELPGRQNELIAKLAKANPRTVVVLNNGSALNVEPWIDRVPALLEMWYPGQENGNALAELLFGKAVPGGRLPFTWAKSLQDYPCIANGTYPGDIGDFYPRSNYLEGEFIGYRHFDRAGIPVRFPFGFGLNYTTFSCRIVKVTHRNFNVKATVEVTNTGKMTGHAVVQCYLKMQTTGGNPVKELQAVAAADLLPGKKCELELALEQEDFARYNEEKNSLAAATGDYELLFATDAENIFDTRKITIQ